MRIAVLSVQGAFIEHEKMLDLLGVSSIELRQKKDTEADFQGIILPGGESTVQGKLLRELDMYDTLNDYIKKGMPVFGTCAGLILLAKKLSNDDNTYFSAMPITVCRNAYGRQLGSFSCSGILNTPKNIKKEIPLRFIRAPYIESIGNDVNELISIDRLPSGDTGKNIVGVSYKNMIGTSFHPELTDDTSLHEMFIEICGRI